MTKPAWAIEMGMEDGHEERLVQSAKDAGCEVWHPKFLPFDGEKPVKPSRHVKVAHGVVFHGTINGAARIKNKPFWIVFENTEQLRCSYYYPRLRERILNRDHFFLPYGCIDAQKDWLLDFVGYGGDIFIRPDSNQKVFTGQLVSEERWVEDMRLVRFYDVAPEEMCVVAWPQNIKAEWRFIVTADRVVTGSRYTKEFQTHRRAPATEDELKRAEEMRQFCMDQGYCPDPIWVLDLCDIGESEWRILEVGSFSSCGLYACDTDKIVEAVNDIVRNL